MRPRTTGGLPPARFTDKLVLTRWILGLFDASRWEELALHLADESLEGLDDENVHRFHTALVTHFPALPALPPDLLLEYDQNIVSFTLRLSERRLADGKDTIVWKYFQYLALLFTEIYLDRYFSDPAALLQALNTQAVAVNSKLTASEAVQLFDDEGDPSTQLNKLAYWSATGSGKTLLMHANILQYKHYLAKHGRLRDMNRVILLTPNEGLSEQHLRNFQMSGIAAELFNKDARGLFSGDAVQILDIHKLKDEMGDTTVAVDSFEENNLVLVDEGHRGASAGEEGTWMRFRNALCRSGFSFEYSATFEQAVKRDKALGDLYAKNILIDYSYRRFYADGFGKDYLILNLDQGLEDAHRDLYLVACLLAFFQQQRLFRHEGHSLRPFNIASPLWVFVGSKVTATLASQDAADIVEILLFLQRYASERALSINQIDRVLNGGVVTSTGRNLFAGRFDYLNTLGLSPQQIFDETLASIFNAPSGGDLYVENLKGATGEIALRIGAGNDPFGLINVGDDTKLVRLCAEQGMATGDREFATRSLFHDLNREDSTVNILIGSKKFTEGWDSPRVSTMGLLNVGRSEGAQIIQLFGRGVRLEGYDGCLKRSSRAELPAGLVRPDYIGLAETLHIFGIHADYMAQFRDFLADEGLPPDHAPVELVLPVIRNLGKEPLKIIRLVSDIKGVPTEGGDPFTQFGPVPTLASPDLYLQKNQTILNWYPKIGAVASGGLDEELPGAKNEAHFTPSHVAFLDLERLYYELIRFKSERGWHNMNIPAPGRLGELLLDQTWYRLLIPVEEFVPDSFAKVRGWQDVAVALLKKYVERYYKYRKQEWELPHLEYRDLGASDPNFAGAGSGAADEFYRVSVDASQVAIVAKLRELKKQIEDRDSSAWEFNGIKAIWFARHLYEPLLALDPKVVEIAPVPLNPGERGFVEDLKAFHDATPDFFKDRQLYLLRNLSKGRGVGFFEAGNFHPDFILWLIAGSKQHVIFVDPKGIRNLGLSDPKIQFGRTVKDIEKRLGDPGVVLDAFIVSRTPSDTMTKQWGVDKATMASSNILFQEEDRDKYVRTMLESVLA